MSESHQEGKTRTVAAAAAANVDGYLRNASKRLRVPSATGGRGTRRKLAMVTAANVDRSPQPVAAANAPEAVDVDDEWDEVVLPNAAAAAVAKDEVKTTKEEEGREVPKVDAAKAAPGGGSVKTEILQVEDGEEGGDASDPSAQSLMQGTRPPLSGTSMQRWRRNDPSYERMLEQQQLLAAQRRSERIRRAAEGMCVLIFALQRAKILVKESLHPQLLRRLLRVSIAEGDVAKSFPLLRAVQRAKESYQRALNPLVRRPALSPCWVTVGKDTVGNYTSSSIMALLTGITSVFTLGSVIDATALSNWAAPVSSGHLFRLLSSSRRLRTSADVKLSLSHSLYFCVIFLALASVSGMSCRLVVAMKKERERQSSVATETSDAPAKPAPMTLFVSRAKRPRNEGAAEGDRASQKLPSSCFWVEVWCPQRESFIAVNPCGGCTALWGAPYTFSVGGDVAMDVTPRYSTKYSSAFLYRRGRCDSYRFFWKHLGWNDNREASEVILDAFRKDMTQTTRAQLERERKQLHSLAYAEEIPKTLTALQKHPLFVIESELARHEGVYPKDKTTIVGSVKGHMVYKRSAVVNLRSRDGWLRVGRCVISEEELPYKVVPPPASRPFAASSSFFGVWQTKLFEPSPLRGDGSLPLHGKTRWYVLLGRPVPEGLVHIQRPNIARVSRRMDIEFGLAVMGFQRRRLEECRYAHWEAVIDGIVVKEVDAANLLHAYDDWRRLTEEQEAAKRRQRANRWWLHFAQRMLAMRRVREQYLDGAVHGSLPLR
ncbi:putative DNA-repair protein [Trypanosoma conorhini]|uniref:Putative DNA-repair protein n=1 Tax=Trypanosoma conorhini TaxID=83891 RepID=A0A422Q9J2_9TRYP|nr:putative DNA-repair protein [Trypanosoma conorhini]RNF26632.1 putative DNA-repair protein [Trypanosoma conorhini]